MPELTFRQKQVAQLVALGYTNKRIAAELGISDRRVRALIAQVAAVVSASPERDDRVRITLWWVGAHQRSVA